MLKSGLLLAVAILFLVTWGAQRVEVGRSLKVVEINTNAFSCDGVSREFDSGLSGVHIRKVYMWFGVYGATYADVVATLEHISGSGKYMSIAKAGWDRYAEPTGVGGQTITFDYAPDWINVGKNDSLKLYAQCNPLNEETKSKKAHVIVLVYYHER